MVCIYCSGATEVINSRHQARHNTVWRRRRCKNCGQIFTTQEGADLVRSWVYVADNGSVHAFQPETLLISLYDSLRHRPKALTDATALAETVTAKLRDQTEDGRLTRHQMVVTCLQVLKRFDKAAATYYDAYHPIKS